VKKDGSEWGYNQDFNNKYSHQDSDCNDKDDIENSPLLRQFVLQNESNSTGTKKSNGTNSTKGSGSTGNNSGKMSGSNANSNI
jgi:hypothetical protein